jgi:hypothetical protein
MAERHICELCLNEILGSERAVTEGPDEQGFIHHFHKVCYREHKAPRHDKT